MPKYTVEMINKYFNKELEDAMKMQIKVSKLIESLFKEVNPIPIKKALELKGFTSGKPRLPLVECSKQLQIELKENLNNL